MNWNRQGAIQRADHQHTDMIWRLIVEFWKTYGYSPSIRDLAVGAAMSASAVIRHLDRLEAKGVILREPGVARSIRVIVYPPDPSLPVQ